MPCLINTLNLYINRSSCLTPLALLLAASDRSDSVGVHQSLSGNLLKNVSVSVLGFMPVMDMDMAGRYLEIVIAAAGGVTVSCRQW